MELTVLNPNFEKIYILDSYESLIWVDKFSEPGTFEIYTPVTNDILTYLVKDNYLVNPDSEHVMIIEDFSLESDVEKGDHIKIIGRSLESILDRRIVWDNTTFTSGYNMQTAIRKIVQKAFIETGSSGEGPKRKVDNFKLAEASTDPSIADLTLEEGVQFYGTTILDTVQTMCQSENIGFKILLSDNNEFIFSLYNGVNRSYNQDALPYVVFRPSFDNVINSNYKEENSKVKNVALIVGTAQSSGGNPPVQTVGTITGLDRRELYINASDISWETSVDGSETITTINATQYNKLLKDRGEKDLKDTEKNKKSFDGKCETTQLYRYGRDFFMGDIVQMANEYGMEASSRITEFTWSYSTSEIETYPTFTAVDEEEEGNS